MLVVPGAGFWSQKETLILKVSSSAKKWRRQELFGPRNPKKFNRLYLKEPGFSESCCVHVKEIPVKLYD